MAQIPKGRLVKGPYKPICRDCAIYFSIKDCNIYVWICNGLLVYPPVSMHQPLDLFQYLHGLVKQALPNIRPNLQK